METVSGINAIRYGISLLGWLVGIGVLGAILAGAGFFVAGGGGGMAGKLVGGLLFLGGGLVTTAGGLGLLYKVISDAMSRSGL